jgi:hypothetical protein
MTSVAGGIDASTARQQRNVIGAVLNVGMTTERSGMHLYVTAHAIIAAVFFIVEHAAILTLLLAVAASAGTVVMGPRVPLSLRAVMGMAIAGQLFILLGTIGALRPWSFWTFAAIALGATVTPAVRRLDRRQLARGSAVALFTLPLFFLALYPPLAFDETLYHLPFVRAIARSGAIRFLAEHRLPAFPQLHELLCVPPFLLAGDTATHLVALVEMLILTGLMIAWPPQRLTGFLAAALVLGNPIVIQMATITYTEAALMLFLAAGFYSLDRNPIAAGFLLGTACSVKYLGCYFAAAGFAYLLLFGTNRRRTIPLFLGGLAAGVLPMYGRIVALTGNPFFPFLPRLFGASPWTLTTQPLPSSHIVTALRLFWDITFARERAGFQPPYSPLFAVAMLITLIAAIRDRRATFIAAVCAGYIAIFTFLPQDSRYLLPLLPLVAMAAASAVAPLLRKNAIVALSLLAIAPGIAYAGYRFLRQGPLPVTSAQRQHYLETHIPEYRALEHRGPGRIYVCGAEQLKYFGGDDLLGDVAGPFAYDTIVGQSVDAEHLWRTFAQSHIRYLLIARAHCPITWQHLPSAPRFELVYADDGAVLWRVRYPLGEARARPCFAALAATRR